MTMHVAATVITLYRAGQTLREIGASLGISPNTVHAILVAAGEPRRGPRRYRRPPTEAELTRDAAVIAAYRAGHSLDDVSRKFGSLEDPGAAWRAPAHDRPEEGSRPETAR